MANKCKCYRTKEVLRYVYSPLSGTPLPYTDVVGYCTGTKECEQCACNGDEAKCDFYPEKRKQKINVKCKDCKIYKELEFTRKFIHEHGLEFALASEWGKRNGNG